MLALVFATCRISSGVNPQGCAARAALPAAVICRTPNFGDDDQPTRLSESCAQPIRLRYSAWLPLGITSARSSGLRPTASAAASNASVVRMPSGYLPSTLRSWGMNCSYVGTAIGVPRVAAGVLGPNAEVKSGSKARRCLDGCETSLGFPRADEDRTNAPSADAV